MRSLACVCVALLFSTGCSQPSGSEVAGTVVFKGKPVYPAIVMLKGDSGKSYTAKLTAKGEFRVFDVEKDNYRVAIETIKLGTKPKPRKVTPKEASKDESGFPTRELAPPKQYKNANVNIPSKYNSFETSGLVIDCSSEYPATPIELNLSK